MKPSVYLETSVISYQAATRLSPELLTAARQQITWDWWDRDRENYDLYVSLFVQKEISEGNPDLSQKRLELVTDINGLAMTPEVELLAQEYFDAIALPDKKKMDAYHLAIGSWHGVDYILSWNFKHILQARTQKIVSEINRKNGIISPVICTPEELLGE